MRKSPFPVGDSGVLPAPQKLPASVEKSVSLETESILAFQVEWFLCFLVVRKAAIAAVWEKKAEHLEAKMVERWLLGRGTMWWAGGQSNRCEAFHCGSLMGSPQKAVVPLLQCLSEAGNPRACPCSSTVARRWTGVWFCSTLAPVPRGLTRRPRALSCHPGWLETVAVGSGCLVGCACSTEGMEQMRGPGTSM